MTEPRVPFPVVLLAVVLVGVITFLLNRMYRENYIIHVASWLIAAIVSILLTLWIVLGHSPLVAPR
jgi:hypothetical protein